MHSFVSGGRKEEEEEEEEGQTAAARRRRRRSGAARPRAPRAGGRPSRPRRSRRSRPRSCAPAAAASRGSARAARTTSTRRSPAGDRGVRGKVVLEGERRRSQSSNPDTVVRRRVTDEQTPRRERVTPPVAPRALLLARVDQHESTPGALQGMVRARAARCRVGRDGRGRVPPRRAVARAARGRRPSGCDDAIAGRRKHRLYVG